MIFFSSESRRGGRTWKTRDDVLGIETRHLQTAVSGTNPGTYQLASNPYYSASPNDPTMGWTRTHLDVQGRVVEVAHFTGSGLPAPWGANSATSGAATTSYSGIRLKPREKLAAPWVLVRFPAA